MNKIVLKARINYHNTLTEGNTYVPVAQSKTGFLVTGDDNQIIDLYGYFFTIGIQDTEGTVTELMSSEKFLSLKGASAKEVERKEKSSTPIVEITKEKTPILEEKKLVSDDFEVNDFIEEADEVLKETKDSPEESSEGQGLDIDIEDF